MYVRSFSVDSWDDVVDFKDEESSSLLIHVRKREG